jgi:hypothetical protein
MKKRNPKFDRGAQSVAAAYHKADKAMRRAWLKEHPGDPLPEHLCALDNPSPGQKRWCAMADRWLDAYAKRTGHFV